MFILVLFASCYNCLSSISLNNTNPKKIELHNLALLIPVATDGIGQILLCIFEPRIEGRSSFGEGQVKIFDLAELLLDGEEALLPSLRVLLETLPSGGKKSADGKMECRW